MLLSDARLHFPLDAIVEAQDFELPAAPEYVHWSAATFGELSLRAQYVLTFLVSDEQ